MSDLIIIGYPDETTAENVWAELVKLHFFAGLSLEEAGQMLGLSYRTAKRHWAYARAWLYARLRQDDGPASAA